MPRKPTILAVDDTPANLVALEAVLDPTFELRFARSGQDAIAQLEKAPDVDVILMDLQMPAMDGFEAARRIKQLPACRDIPIVFITAVFAEDPYVRRGYEVGGIDYFTKPFDPDLLRLKLGVYASFRQKAAVFEERERQRHDAEELERTGRALASAVDNNLVGVLISDLDGRICQANDEVVRILNVTNGQDGCAELLGWWDANGQLLEGEGKAVTRALRVGESSHCQVQMRGSDGSARKLRASVSPLRSRGGDVVGVVIVISDLTEPQRIEAELETRIAHLVSAGDEPDLPYRPH